MPKQSAGLLLYCWRNGQLQVLLAHPGGPFWMRRDAGAWSVPKGEFADDEKPVDAAQREFTEETGFKVDGPLRCLGSVKQPSGKVVHAWALHHELDPSGFESNTFTLEWPPKSGRRREFPEIDKLEWFSIETARTKIVSGQAGFLQALEDSLRDSDSERSEA